MGRPEKVKVVIRDFAGLVTNGDPLDIEPGAAQRQVNASAERPGELRPRMGYARVKFEE
jgi:hypothetical protein